MPMRVGLGKLRAGGWSDDGEQMKRKWGEETGNRVSLFHALEYD